MVMNKYLISIEKVAMNALKSRVLAKGVGVIAQPGSQWKRAIRDSKNFKSVEDFQNTWKHKVPNTFKVEGTATAITRTGEKIPGAYNKYTKLTDSLKSIENKGLGKVTFLNGEAASIKTKGSNLQIHLKSHNNRNILEAVGSTVSPTASDTTRGKGLFKGLWPHISKELRKRGITHLEMEPQSPVWHKNYKLEKIPEKDVDYYKHRIPTK
jgi:hypothetical protein